MIQLWYTIRFSIRMLAARPVMTILSVLTMGIGIGVTTSQLMIFQGLMYPKLPLPKAEQIVTVSNKEAGKLKHGYVHSHLFQYWQAHQTQFESLFSYAEGTVNVFFQNRAIRYTGSWVDVGFIDALGVKPFLGEGFLEGDDQLEMPKKAMLGYDAWERDFASDPSIIGKEILVNSETAMVVGVMPRGFKFPFNSNIWIPDVFYPGQLVAYDSNPASFVAGRLRDGVDPEVAADELNRLSGEFLAQVSTDFREALEGKTEMALVPYVESMTDKVTKNILYLSSTVVILVLLIACANVTNLLLAGFATRMKEMAIRCALGASRRDMAFQLWFESFLIAAAGALVGIVYCMWATDWGNLQLTRMEAPFWYHLSFNAGLFWMIMGITALSSILAAALPMTRVGHLSINQVLQDDSRTGSTLNIGVTNKTLVVLQISISCALLIVAGMMIKQIYSIRSFDLGFDTHSVLAARMGLFEGKYKSVQSRSGFIHDLLHSLNEQEEIEAAAITTRMQLIHPNMDVKVRVPDAKGTYSGEPVEVFSEGVSNLFFDCLAMPFVEGGTFDTTRIPLNGLKQVIVTVEFARTYFPKASAVGKKLQIVQEIGSNTMTEEFEIVGVVGNTFMRGGFQDASLVPGVHLHFSSVPHRFLTIVIRPRAGYSPYSLVPLLKRCVADVDREIPLYFVETPHDSIENEFAGLRFAADLFVIFSAVALFLSFAGIFGITTFSILERIQEIGIRKAIGATGAEVFAMVFRKGVLELIVGLILGTLGGISLTFALNSIFLKTGLVDPWVYLVVVVILTASSLLATVYPARRAAFIQPAEATRVN